MRQKTVHGVDVAFWNPRRQLNIRPRRLSSWTRKSPLGPRLNNFGDLIGPVIVEQCVERRNLPHASRGHDGPVLAAVGSIIHMLPQGSTVWGAGVNGKHLGMTLPRNLDVRAVRGPLTQRYLSDQGVVAPAVYGDPALLVDYSRLGAERHHGGGVICINNLNDLSGKVIQTRGHRGFEFVSPIESFPKILRAISSADLVVGSSLHAIIVAEALGIPARVVRSTTEPLFKYEDYYEGTGRTGVRTAATVEAAMDMGGVDAQVELDPGLLSAFPSDLWTGYGAARSDSNGPGRE